MTDLKTPIGELGEFALIAMITEGLAAGPDVLLGPGDDAAILAVEGPLVTSMDVLVEGVHFRRDWSTAHDVGRKAVAVNVADLEAMGARAQGIVVGFSAPADLPVGWVRDFSAGLRAEAAAAGVSLIGGDITRAREVTVAVTVLGGLDGREPVRRDGARPGDVVALNGRLGWAAAGLTVLSRGFRSPRVVVQAYGCPQVPYGAGAAASRAGATAMIDVSDGLLGDLGHLVRASGVGIDLRSDDLEIPEPLQAVAAATGIDPYALVLTGGEDHALAATFPPASTLPAGWKSIGTVHEPGADGPAVLVDQTAWTAPAGYDHFRPRR